MADLLAVVTLASTTTSTRRVQRFGAVGLVVAVVGQYHPLVEVKKSADLPRLVAVEAETIGASATTAHGLTRLGAFRLTMSVK
jgi:hypothetical protein